jgi:ribosomal protein S27AE
MLMGTSTARQDKVSTDKIHEATCPSCGRLAKFDFAGQQRWPPRVAQRAGIPEVVNLWHCGACKSTISEQSLSF